jgi:hypothetical protein
MDPAEFAVKWADIERRLCRGEAWEALSDADQAAAREYLRQNFKTYLERQAPAAEPSAALA